MSSDAETQRLLGEIKGQMGTVLTRLDKLDEKVDSVVAMTNRWKGATSLLIILGGFIGWASNWILKGHG